MNVSNLFEEIPAVIHEELFDVIVQREGLKIERIVSRGHKTPEHNWYDQDCNEWVMVLVGGAILLFDDGEEFILNAGSYVNIPAHQKHKVLWTDPNVDTVWLAVHY